MWKGGITLKIQSLDEKKLFNILLRTPLVSMHAHHKHIKSTLKDYVMPSEDDLEAQYVKDLFTLETDEIIEKWYGGEEAAATLLFNLKK